VLSGNTLPVVRGELVAQTPEDHPQELVLAARDPAQGDIKLIMNKPLPKAAPLGTLVDL
jgi:hypothetical protein